MKLVVVSNRLPARLTRAEAGGWDVAPSSGGLVTAMTPILNRRGGLWIGWPGVDEVQEEELAVPLSHLAERTGYHLHPVPLTPEEKEGYYFGFSNEVLWPLFHDLQSRANFEAAYWQAYQEVNRKFAGTVARLTEPDDIIWIHDYHLMMVAGALREQGVTSRLEFFLHTPFPSPDIFANLPWRAEILRGLLDYDATGFQTERDRDNYLQCVRQFIPEADIAESGRVRAVRTPEREAHVGAFPISIDYDHFAALAASADVTAEMQRLQARYAGQHLVLGVDRLDYTKGIPHRLHAFAAALEKYPELHERITLIQLVVPSRDVIPEYAALKTEIEQLVGQINGTYTRAGWVPIHYLFRGLPQDELVALYRTARTMLVTPLKDGMNLVSKEYCASDLDETGALILSEFAGSATQLGADSLLVNPNDTEGVADALHAAFHMDDAERQERMRRMRRTVAQEDIFWWVDTFLEAAEREAAAS